MFPLLNTTKMMRGGDWVLLEVYYLYLQKAVEKSSTYPPFIYKLCFGIPKSWWEKVLHSRISALNIVRMTGNDPLGNPSWNKGSKQWLSVATKTTGQRLMGEFPMEGSGCHHLNPVDQIHRKQITRYWVPSEHTLQEEHSPTCRKFLPKTYLKKVATTSPQWRNQGLPNFWREARNRGAFI